MDIVELSRLQFAVTALYHFLFVPLTLGLSVLLGIMESVYVMTGRADLARHDVKFWGMLFGINFAMGVATGITMEFQFGTNWAYYSHYVGDVFGAPLAIEGLMAFFLEATFVGLFFFAWDRLSKVQHLIATWALGARHQPFGAVDPDRQWLDAVSGRRALQCRHHAHGSDRLHGGAVQSRGAGEIRAYGERRLCHRLDVRAGDQRLLSAARPPCRIRQALDDGGGELRPGLALCRSSCWATSSGYTAGQNQKMKIAAIEAMWDTEPAPASFTLFGLPDLASAHHTNMRSKFPGCWA